MKSSNPLVSIIIPVYNGSNYLKDAIDSALGQTYLNIEVLVINDGSTDNGKTEKIAQSYGKRIRYFLKRNGGVATALNFGINKMRGEWFSWLSHDDIYMPTKIEMLVEYIRVHPKSKILYTDYELINANKVHLHNVSVKPGLITDMQLRLIDSYPLNGCAMIIRKECFKTVGLFNVSLPTTQDYDLWFKLASVYDFIYVPISTLKSRLHPEQGSHTYSHISEVDNLYSRYIKNITYAQIKKAYGNNSMNWLYGVARLYKGRGYIKCTTAVMLKISKIRKHVNLNYLYTRIYCALPYVFLKQLLSIKQNAETSLYSVTGYLKRLLKYENKSN